MRTAIIGAGAMGGALAEGLLKSGAIEPSNLTIADPCKAALKRFEGSGASITIDNSAAVADADTLFVVVKPWLVQQVIEGIMPHISGRRLTIVVIAAGVPSASISHWLQMDSNPEFTLFLAIPNTAIAVMQSMTFLVPAVAEPADTEAMKGLFEKVGECIVTEERLLAAGTTLASCGIAYAMRYIRAATEGGVEIGFKAHDAQQIVQQTVKGAVALLQATGNHPEAEIDKVTTPGGVTIKGLNEMEHAGFTSAVIRGLKAGMKA